MKKCPYCGEKIMVSAKKCRYCHERLEEEKSHTTEQKSKDDDKDDISDGTSVNWEEWIKVFLFVAVLIVAFLTVPSESKHEDSFVSSMSDVIREKGRQFFANEDIVTQAFGNGILRSDKVTEALVEKTFTLDYHNCYLFSYGVAENNFTEKRKLVTIGIFGFVIDLTSIMF